MQFIIIINVIATVQSYMRNIISRNPYSGEIKSKIQFLSSEALPQYIAKSLNGYNINSKRSTKDKNAIFKELARQIQRKEKDMANLITFQTGKSLIASQFEVKESLKVLKYYMEPQRNILPLNVKTDAKKKTLIKYLPLGIIYQILPFNYPLFLNIYKTIPQLLLGNSVLVKNAQTTPETAKFIESIMIRAGFQSGEYQNIFANDELSEEIIKDEHVKGISFTGSTQNGKKIGSIAGKYLKKSSLHLSSNDSVIILQDGNIDLAISQLFKSTQFNSGQGFPNPKRILIKSELYENVKIKLIEKISKLFFGNPFDRKVEIGPIARQDLYTKLQKQQQQITKKFKIIYSRSDMQRPFFPITIIQGQKQIYDEQIIGPILFLYKCETDQQIVNLVNQSRYGNSNYIFSQIKRSTFSNELRGSNVHFNEISFFNPMIPMGGMGQSGYGYQGWNEGIRQFANIKTNYIN